MSKTEFMTRFGAVYEHAPEISEAVFDSCHGHIESEQTLISEFHKHLEQAGTDKQLKLLNAHPQLACAPASKALLTDESKQEQNSAGLDQCSAEEFAEFTRLNQTYAEKFGFPFIVAVKGLTRQHILKLFRNRINNARDSEFDEALKQVMKIGALRISGAFHE